jgi:lysozyme
MSLEQLFRLIKHFEGCVLEAYQDSGGVWTIGYGSTGWDVYPGLTWTQEQADERMERDARKFAVRALRLSPGLSSSSARCAIADFCYNLGSGNYKASTLRRKINAGDMQGAAKEIMRWVHCRGKVLPGLVKRRAAERQLLLGE